MHTFEGLPFASARDIRDGTSTLEGAPFSFQMGVAFGQLLLEVLPFLLQGGECPNNCGKGRLRHKRTVEGRREPSGSLSYRCAACSSSPSSAMTNNFKSTRDLHFEEH